MELSQVLSWINYTSLAMVLVMCGMIKYDTKIGELSKEAWVVLLSMCVVFSCVVPVLTALAWSANATAASRSLNTSLVLTVVVGVVVTAYTYVATDPDDKENDDGPK